MPSPPLWLVAISPSGWPSSCNGCEAIKAWPRWPVAQLSSTCIEGQGWMYSYLGNGAVSSAVLAWQISAKCLLTPNRPSPL